MKKIFAYGNRDFYMAGILAVGSSFTIPEICQNTVDTAK